MIELGVNVDHVATIREARKDPEPDAVTAAALCEVAGAHQITVHLRGDRRHIQDRDLEILRKTVKSKLNLEMAATDEMVGIATGIKPDQATLVPEKREEITTEGGLDIAGQVEHITATVAKLKQAGIHVSLFIDPDEEQVRASAETGADCVELHTGQYANARAEAQAEELRRIKESAVAVRHLGMAAHAGHGLTYHNVGSILEVSEIEELNIGHSIIARAILVGLDRAVRDRLKRMGRL